MHGRLLLGVFGTLAFVVGCSQSDSGITASVKSKLVSDDIVKARNINVDTKDRVVTLTGAVQSPTEENRALEIARNTKGVADVVDRLAVGAAGEPNAAPTAGQADSSPAGTVGGTISDSTITSDVKARLLADPDVSGFAINVDTRDRVVTLSGTVPTSAQKERAVELANKAENVSRVEDNIMVQQASSSSRTPSSSLPPASPQTPGASQSPATPQTPGSQPPTTGQAPAGTPPSAR